MPNRLAGETSPYLLQHKDNPVDWYPWGPDALGRATAEDRPIFLSIGYAACHWCHVMERESFEDPTTAAVMNELFVNIKVDREERPDLDTIYMEAVQALTGRGGWPMSVFLTPDGVPFYGGTYYPPSSRGGMPSFRQVLEAVHEAWTKRRDDIDEQGAGLLEVMGQTDRLGALSVSDVLLDDVVPAVLSQWDHANGGFGGAPKFPQPMTLEFLLRMHVRTGSAEPLAAVERGLRKMAHGGLYDQLGGGFARYSVDAQWAVPHFEKMLYDNAQLVPVYLHAWQLTSEPLYRRIVEETLDYLVREMRQREGGISSTQDADSEGEEGKFFVWTPEQLRDVLGRDRAQRAQLAFGVTEAGNFEHGTTVLSLADDGVFSQEEMDSVRADLLAVREERVHPATDDKVLASWNGLALAAFAEAGRVLGHADYVEVASGIAEFVTAAMTRDGRLHHSWRAGTLSVPGFCEDSAAMAVGLLELYESTGDDRWFAQARRLVDDMIDRFADTNDDGRPNGFFTTADDAEALVLRPKDLMDNAVPAPNSLAADACARLALFTGEARYDEHARGAIAAAGAVLGKHPTAFGRLLSVFALLGSEPVEIALVGDGAGLASLRAAVDPLYLPFAVTATGDGNAGDDATVPLLALRTPVDGSAAAYLCRNFTCDRPVTDPEELRRKLAVRV